jgi:hypothetical protein
MPFFAHVVWKSGDETFYRLMADSTEEALQEASEDWLTGKRKRKIGKHHPGGDYRIKEISVLECPRKIPVQIGLTK